MKTEVRPFGPVDCRWLMGVVTILSHKGVVGHELEQVVRLIIEDTHRCENDLVDSLLQQQDEDGPESVLMRVLAVTSLHMLGELLRSMRGGR